jgi:dihydropteroate synthase
VNDISGFRFDDNMSRVVADTGAGVVLMHSRGSRETLHQQIRMNDPLREVAESLERSADRARASGISADAIVMDPGIGFGKTADESVTVLKSLNVFSKLGYPLLAGTSRKSFIRFMTSDSVEDRIWGTAATIVAAIMNGAHIVRVHDIRQARTLADVADRMT